MHKDFSRVEGTREEEEGQGGGKIVFFSKMQSEVIIEILMLAIFLKIRLIHINQNRETAAE